MRLKNKFVLALVCSLSYINIYASATIYKGTVVFPDSLMFPYSVELLKDSTVEVTKNFSGGSFTISGKDDINSLRVYSFGYEPVYIHLKNQGLDTVSINPIYLKEAAFNLDEVVATAKKAVVKTSGMNYTISNIRDSYIGNAGSLLDMLGWTPGVSVVNNETIKVLGRDTSPLVYVDGTKILNISELRALSSTNVNKIEVLRSPGAEYPMGTSSVILITTSKPIGEMVNGELSENLSVQRAFSNSLRASTYGRIKKVNFRASLSYSDFRNRQNSEEKIETFTDGDIPDMNQSIYESDKPDTKSLQWFAGANYTTKNKSTILLQYSGRTGKTKRLFETYRSISRGLDNAEETYSTFNKSVPQYHGVTGSYSKRIKGGNFKIRANYIYMSNTEDESYTGVEDRKNDARSHYDYNMWILKGDYSHNIKSLGRHSFGFYLGYVDNRMNLENLDLKENQHVKSSSKWAEVYYSIRGDIKKFSFQTGIRGRYEYNAMTEEGKDRKTLTYPNVAPDVELTYDFSDDYSLSATYSLSYNLPTFRQLNPVMRLSNMIFYTQGNPDLKQAHNNLINLTANLKSFTLYAEYYNSRNSIFDITQPFGDGMLLTRPINMTQSTDYLMALEYTVQPTSRFRIYGQAKGVWSQYEYKYQDKPFKSSGWYAQVNLNTSYQLGKFSLFFNGRYDSPQKVDNMRLSYRLSLNLGVDCSLLKKRLYLRLEGKDLTNRSITPAWEAYSPNLYEYRRNRYDTRGVSLTIRYTFNTTKTGFRQEMNGSDIIRMN